MSSGFGRRAGELIDGRFRLVERIGAGASAVVYRAFDEEDRSAVAVKILRPELLASDAPEARSAVARFRREITLYERLGPSLYVPDLVVGRAEGDCWYIAMELVEGRTLRTLLEQFPQGLAPAAFMMLGRELVRGLAEIHARGVLHRDLAPGNVAVLEVGGAIEVRFLDFGTGKTLEAEIDPVTRQATIAGTPQYLSPEQTRGLDIDAASDVYALGVILYELACGRVPIAVRSFAELARIRREIPQSLRTSPAATWIPGEILDLVDGALAKEAVDRPLVDDLLEVFDRYGGRPEWSLADAGMLAPPPPGSSAEPRRPQGASEELDPGQQLGPYILEHRLDRLGPRETWRARLADKGIPRVLTCARLEGEERLVQLETGLAATARPTIPGHRPMLDARLLEGFVVWVSPWCAGVSLAEELERQGPLRPSRLLAVTREIVEARARLEATHALALHGYLHPGHVILDEFDGVTLLNAGRSFPWTWTSPFARDRLEFAFLAPEQAISGRTMPESDTFALAALVDAMLRGEAARRGTREALLHATLKGPPDAPRGPGDAPLPTALRRLLARAMDPDPVRRPAPFDRFASALLDQLAEAAGREADSHVAD